MKTDILLQIALPLSGAANTDDTFLWQTKSSSASFGSTSVDVVTSARPGRQPVQRLRSDSGDSASSAEEASDSDSDEAPFAKRKCPNGRSAMSVSLPSPAAARPQKKYNIWGSVLQEQTLANDLSGWFGMNTKVISDRNVETYDYRNARMSSLADSGPDAVDTDNIDIADECEEPQTHDSDVNICDRETFGTCDSSRADDAVQNHSEDEDKRLRRKRKRDGSSSVFSRLQLQRNPNVPRQSAKDRLSRRTYDVEKDRSHVRVGISDSAAAVGEELVRVLAEPEHMKDTFGNFNEIIVNF